MLWFLASATEHCFELVEFNFTLQIAKYETLLTKTFHINK